MLSVYIVLLIVPVMVAAWRLFAKAGQPGWAAIVPFYNLYVVLRIVGRPGYWLALMFIPVANVVLLIIVLVDLAKSFGKGGEFSLLLLFLPFVGFPLLGFGNAVYRGPSVTPPGHQPGWTQPAGHPAQYGAPPQPVQSFGYPSQSGPQPVQSFGNPSQSGPQPVQSFGYPSQSGPQPAQPFGYRPQPGRPVPPGYPPPPHQHRPGQ